MAAYPPPTVPWPFVVAGLRRGQGRPGPALRPHAGRAAVLALWGAAAATPASAGRREGGRHDGLRGRLLAGAAASPLTVRQHCGGRLAVESIYGYVRGRKRCVRGIDEPCYVLLTRPDRLPRDYRSQPNDATKDLSRLRGPTRREASLIQTFPESWDWDGVRLRDAWRMTGNAVPPRPAEHPGRAVLAAPS